MLKQNKLNTTINLNKIFDDVKAPLLMDFISLDVEGSELEVLSGVNFSKYNLELSLYATIYLSRSWRI